LINEHEYYIEIVINYNLNNKEMIERFYKKAKEHGLKITPQRTAIYRELLKAKDHPSANIIYREIVKKIPDISFDTVNRTLLTSYSNRSCQYCRGVWSTQTI
jgi:transcriptional regulator